MQSDAPVTPISIHLTILILAMMPPQFSRSVNTIQHIQQSKTLREKRAGHRYCMHCIQSLVYQSKICPVHENWTMIVAVSLVPAESMSFLCFCLLMQSMDLFYQLLKVKVDVFVVALRYSVRQRIQAHISYSHVVVVLIPVCGACSVPNIQKIY